MSLGIKTRDLYVREQSKAVDRNYGLRLGYIHSYLVDTLIFSLFLPVIDACRIQNHDSTVSNRWGTMQMNVVLLAIISHSLIGQWSNCFRFF